MTLYEKRLVREQILSESKKVYGMNAVHLAVRIAMTLYERGITDFRGNLIE